MSDATPSPPVFVSMPLPHESEYLQPIMPNSISVANSVHNGSDTSSTGPGGQETTESSANGSDPDTTSGTDANDSTKEATSAGSHSQVPVIKHVDRYLNLKDGTWGYKDTASSLPAEAYVASSGSDTPSGLEDCCFGVVRRLPHPRDSDGTISFHFLMKCKELLKVFDDVMGDISGTSWNEDPVKVKPELLLTFFPKLLDFHGKLSSRSRTDGEEHAMQVLGQLLEYLRANYGQTLSKIIHLTSYGEISFDLLYSILIPQTLLVTRCSWTQEPRVYRLRSASKKTTMQRETFYLLSCESLSTVDPQEDDVNVEQLTKSPAAISRRAFGTVGSRFKIDGFEGVRKISSLDIYPLTYHPNQDSLKRELVERGRKWASLSGVRHVQYAGIAGRRDRCDNLVKYSINSRVMLDRATWKIVDANYDIPTPDDPDLLRSSSDVSSESEIPLTDEELLLASPILYGFSLSDKIWLEFNVKNLSPIVWNDEAFSSLVLPPDRKDLLRSLIEAHDAESIFDDFVRGKGQGLVINLFGPPGVGKTLSAEATSEHLRRPLYVVGSGDLGTSPSSLDDGLEQIFEIAARWNAIVLIDEADVFLEERSLHDILRNAMVAVFLRHIEYYRGILFLTTNRISTFDEAFLSRIHVALHFDELPTSAKVQIWRSFLKKAGVTDEEIPPNLVQTLADRNVNGRQIKNACRTATSLARSRGERLTYQHLVGALDTMEEFLNRFANMKRESVEMEK